MRSLKYSYLLFLVISFPASHTFSQQASGLISGPWAGNVELRNATIWMEVSSKVKSPNNPVMSPLATTFTTYLSKSKSTKQQDH